MKKFKRVFALGALLLTLGLVVTACGDNDTVNDATKGGTNSEDTNDTDKNKTDGSSNTGNKDNTNKNGDSLGDAVDDISNGVGEGIEDVGDGVGEGI